MLRTILLGCALAATALFTTPASAEEICARVDVNAPTGVDTGRLCNNSYWGTTVCTTPGIGWGPSLDVDTEACIPRVFPPV